MANKIVYTIVTNNAGEICTNGCYESLQMAQDKFNTLVCNTLSKLKDKTIKILKSEHDVLSVHVENDCFIYEVHLITSTLYYANNQ